MSSPTWRFRRLAAARSEAEREGQVACNRLLACLLSERVDKDDSLNSSLKLAQRRGDLGKAPCADFLYRIKAHKSVENVTGARPGHNRWRRVYPKSQHSPAAVEEQRAA